MIFQSMLKTGACLVTVMALLVWYQPRAIFALADFIEQSSAWVVRWLRIRAAAKQDAMATYRRSLAWHRGIL